MGRQWQDEDISKVMKKMARTDPAPMAYERAWFKIEEGLSRREGHPALVWRPWSHPIRWVAAAACLLMVFSGIFYRQSWVDQNDLGGYLINVANTADSVTRDPGLVRVSVLLSEPTVTAPDIAVENHVDPLSVDEIFL